MSPRGIQVAVAGGVALVGALLWFVLRNDPTSETGRQPRPDDDAAPAATIDARPEPASAVPAVRSVEPTLPTAAAPPATATEWDVDPALKDTMTVTVRAVDAAGAPVPAATLHLGIVGRPYLRTSVDPIPETPIAHGDDDGRISWSVDRATLERVGIVTTAEPFPLLSFVAAAPNHRSNEFRRGIAFGTSHDLGEVVLEAGATLTGRVVDADGQPAARVLVATRAASGSIQFENRFAFGRRAPWTRTSADGTFRLDGVQNEEVIVLAIAGADPFDATNPMGFSERVDLRTAESVPPITIALDRGPPAELTIRGVVRCTKGTPVAGAYVRVTGAGGLLAGAGFVSPVTAEGGFQLTTMTNAAGEFACACLPEAAARVRADTLHVDVRDPRWEYAEQRYGPVALGRTDIEITLSPVRRIDVAFVDEDHRPVRECTAYVSLSAGLMSVLTRVHAPTDATTISVPVPASTFFVGVGTLGYRYQWLGPFEPATAPARLDVVLERRAGIRGVVLARGEPIAGARVSLSSRDSKADSEITGERIVREVRVVSPVDLDTCVTDSSGAFEVHTHTDDGLSEAFKPAGSTAPPSTRAPTLVVRAGLDGTAMALLPASAYSGAYDAGSIQLATGATVTGRVRGFVAGAPLVLDRGDGSVIVVPVAADGTFRVDNVGAGTWRAARLRAGGSGIPQRSGALDRPLVLANHQLERAHTASFVVPAGGSVDVELEAARAPTPVTIAFAWGSSAPESITCQIVPLDAATGSTSTSGKGWNPSIPMQVQVDREGRFDLTVSARVARRTVFATETVLLAPGVPATWELRMAPVDLAWTPPARSTPTNAFLASSQTVRPNCTLTTLLFRDPSSVACVPGIANAPIRLIHLPGEAAVFPTSADIERAETVARFDAQPIAKQ